MPQTILFLFEALQHLYFPDKLTLLLVSLFEHAHDLVKFQHHPRACLLQLIKSLSVNLLVHFILHSNTSLDGFFEAGVDGSFWLATVTNLLLVFHREALEDFSPLLPPTSWGVVLVQ